MKNSYKNFIRLSNKNENKIKHKIKKSISCTSDMVFSLSTKLINISTISINNNNVNGV